MSFVLPSTRRFKRKSSMARRSSYVKFLLPRSFHALVFLLHILELQLSTVVVVDTDK
ncbi:hypothetical protein Plhal703r1_c19g0087431 [Plasmopara halstedii]